jgi:uncharacterized cupredoxin-like copper-binding protein
MVRLAVCALLALLAAGPSAAQPSLGSLFLADETHAVELNDFAFAPKELTLKMGRSHRLVLRNKGQVMHYFGSADFFKAIEIVGVISGGVARAHTGQSHIPVNPGDSKELIVKVKEPGQFIFTCFIPTHVYNGMTGTVAIVP